MVYHPLKKLVGAGVRDILLVSGTEHMGDFVELLGSGREHGCGLTYRVQDEAGGIAQALGLAELYCHNARCLVVLGDNIFFDSLADLVAAADKQPEQAWVLLKQRARPAALRRGRAARGGRRRHRGEAGKAAEAITPWPASTCIRRTCSRSSARCGPAPAASWKSPT